MINQKLTFPFFLKGFVRCTFKIDTVSQIVEPENLNGNLPVLVDILGLKKLKLLALVLCYNYVFCMLG